MAARSSGGVGRIGTAGATKSRSQLQPRRILNSDKSEAKNTPSSDGDGNGILTEGGPSCVGVTEKGKGKVDDVICLGSENPKGERPAYASWFQNNRNLQAVEKLIVYEGIEKGRVKFDEDDVAEARKTWEATLMGAIPGIRTPLTAIGRFIRENWKVREPYISMKENGVMLFRFHSIADRDWVLANGPWNFAGTKRLLLKEWKAGMKLSWEEFEKVPLWVCFPDLSPIYFHPRLLSKIGCAIGTPVCIDECTLNCSRISYARLLIEVNANEAMRKEIEIVDHAGNVVKQKVIFEWRPIICNRYHTFWHNQDNCHKERDYQDGGEHGMKWRIKNDGRNISNGHKEAQAGETAKGDNEIQQGSTAIETDISINAESFDKSIEMERKKETKLTTDKQVSTASGAQLSIIEESPNRKSKHL